MGRVPGGWGWGGKRRGRALDGQVGWMCVLLIMMIVLGGGIGNVQRGRGRGGRIARLDRLRLHSWFEVRSLGMNAGCRPIQSNQNPNQHTTL